MTADKEYTLKTARLMLGTPTYYNQGKTGFTWKWRCNGNAQQLGRLATETFRPFSNVVVRIDGNVHVSVRWTACVMHTAATLADIDTQLLAIAKRELDVETLTTRNSDSLDFHSLSAASIRRALWAAYEAGRASK
jgi:hypothetical protein